MKQNTVFERDGKRGGGLGGEASRERKREREGCEVERKEENVFSGCYQASADPHSPPTADLQKYPAAPAQSYL